LGEDHDLGGSFEGSDPKQIRGERIKDPNLLLYSGARGEKGDSLTHDISASAWGDRRRKGIELSLGGNL